MRAMPENEIPPAEPVDHYYYALGAQDNHQEDGESVIIGSSEDGITVGSGVIITI